MIQFLSLCTACHHASLSCAVHIASCKRCYTSDGTRSTQCDGDLPCFLLPLTLSWIMSFSTPSVRLDLLLEIGFQPVFAALGSSLRRRHPAIPPPIWWSAWRSRVWFSVSRNFTNSIVFHSVDVLIPLTPSLSRQSYNVLYVADSSYFLVGYSVT